jgi:hypothetical protein
MDSIIELMNAISEMYQAKTDNSQIYQSLGTNRERLIHKSDIFTPTNHKDRSYNMFDPTTKSNVTQPLSKRTLNGLTVGDHYLPKYSPAQEQFLRDKHPEYKNLVGSFSNYYQSSKKYFGNKTLILDERRFEILYSHFLQAKSMNPHLNSNKLWDLYTVSFDANWLGSEKGKSLTLSGYVSNIDILPMGKKYSELVGDVSISDYRIYSEIMDKSDNDYNNLINKHNYEQGLKHHKRVLGS